jgi:hypothetical protein
MNSLVNLNGQLEKLDWGFAEQTKCYAENIRDKIFAAETFLKELPQVSIPIQHYFSQGVYAREITIPAGVILTGEIHKFAQLNILSKGRMQVYTEEGIREVEAPFTVVSPPGTKRIAHTLTECVWTTIHGTDETDVELIEKHFIAKDEKEWLEFYNQQTAQLELGL